VSKPVALETVLFGGEAPAATSSAYWVAARRRNFARDITEIA